MTWPIQGFLACLNKVQEELCTIPTLALALALALALVSELVLVSATSTNKVLH